MKKAGKIACPFLFLHLTPQEHGCGSDEFPVSFRRLTAAPFLIFEYHPMTMQQTAMLLLAGVSAALGQFSVTNAYAFAPAREISVFDYSQVVFSAILGFFLFQQIPDLYSLLGYLIVCGSAVGMFLRSNRKDAQTV